MNCQPGSAARPAASTDSIQLRRCGHSVVLANTDRARQKRWGLLALSPLSSSTTVAPSPCRPVNGMAERGISSTSWRATTRRSWTELDELVTGVAWRPPRAATWSGVAGRRGATRTPGRWAGRGAGAKSGELRRCQQGPNTDC